MTDNELKKLKRTELLEMLLDQMKENEALKEQADSLKAQVEDRAIRLGKCGSIAEAALQLNGMFEAAEASIQQYTDNIKDCDRICRNMEAEAKQKAEMIVAQACQIADMGNTEREQKSKRLLEEATQKSEEMMREASEQARKLVSDAEEQAKKTVLDAELYAKKMVDTAKEQAEQYWAETSGKLQKFYEDHRGLKEILNLHVSDN